MEQQFLQDIVKLNRDIKIKEEQLEMLRNRAVNISPNMTGDRVQSSIKNNSMDNILEAVELQEIILSEMRELFQKQLKIYSWIKQYEGVERAILELRYINGKNLYYIADKLNYSYRQIKRIHSKLVSDFLSFKSE